MQMKYRYLKVISITIILSLLIACSSNESTPPNSDELKNIFDKSSNQFEEIKEMMITDVGFQEVLQIGDNSKNADKISKDRYQKYTSLLKLTGAERVTAYTRSKINTSVSFLVYRSGIVTGGCLTKILFMTSGRPKKPDWANPYQLTVLGNGWYGETKCN